MPARILIADDDLVLQRLMMQTLSNEGYEVILAHDGNEALEVVTRERPDLVVLDVIMPGYSGFELCQMLRQRPDMVAMPIIMLSGLADIQEKVSGLRAGADEYLTKPIDLRELTARVDGLLHRNRLVRQSAAPRHGQIMTVIGAKGGVGVTTVVLNLAALLAKLGKQVIAVELHPDFSTFSGQLRTVTPAHTLAETLAMEPALITETFVGSHLVATTFGPRILFGPQKLDEFGALDPTRIGVILGRLLPQADYIVVDLPAVTSPAHETVVKNSAIVVVVLEPEITSVSAASVRLQQLAAWGANDSAIKLLVVNRQGTMMLSRREIENRLSREIDGVAPPASESLNIAVQYGNPLVLYQPEHQTSINLADFVTRITKKPVSASK